MMATENEALDELQSTMLPKLGYSRVFARRVKSEGKAYTVRLDGDEVADTYVVSASASDGIDTDYSERFAVGLAEAHETAIALVYSMRAPDLIKDAVRREFEGLWKK